MHVVERLTNQGSNITIHLSLCVCEVVTMIGRKKKRRKKRASENCDENTGLALKRCTSHASEGIGIPKVTTMRCQLFGITEI